MDTTSSTHPVDVTGGRALVLGGGGSTGNAWLIGVVAGLAGAGIDLTEADVIIGTSAGATAAAQLTGTAPADLLAATLEPPPARAVTGAPRGRPSSGGIVADHLDRFRRIIGASQDAADMRRRMGAIGIELDDGSDGAATRRWRAVVAARLPDPRWPQRRVLLTAIDARTGEPAVFDRGSGVDLVDAVAASTSGASAYRIGDRWYLDGAYRRNENADLATGFARVIILSPLGGRSLHPPEWGMQLAAQVEELRAGGSRVETVVPDATAEHLFGVDAMDASLRPAAARAGHDQGRALADRLGEFWR